MRPAVLRPRPPEPLAVETIVAVSTGAAEGGIGIVRLSGPAAPDIAAKLFASRGGRPLHSFPPFRLVLGTLRLRQGGDVLDEVLAVRMPRGRSFTREPMVEFHAHGGQAVLAMIVRAACAAGARGALPGEFTKRAFLNGRIDLAQAEAVIELIRAGSEAAGCCAARQLQGELSREIAQLREESLRLAAEAEGLLDFAEEHTALPPNPDARGLESLADHATALIKGAAAWRRADAGLRVVLIGRTNAGKSSIFNMLCGNDRAVVTPVPGTTRDFLEERVTIRGFSPLIVDTAGIGFAHDEAEEEGMRRTRLQAERADLVVIVCDGSREVEEADRRLLSAFKDRFSLVALTKKDLPPVATSEMVKALAPALPVFEISSATGEGYPRLLDALASHCRVLLPGEISQESLPLGSRHLEVLRRYLAHLESGRELARQGHFPELVAAELHSAVRVLGEITGETASEEVLERIFGRFCIGK